MTLELLPAGWGPKQSPRTAAYHEAGHVALYHLFGIPTQHVSIENTEHGCTGIAYVGDGWIGPKYASVVVNFGGLVAALQAGAPEDEALAGFGQAIVNGRRRMVTGSDLAAAYRTTGGDERAMALAGADALRAIRDPAVWALVEKVAVPLLERGRLDADQLADLLP